MTLAAAHAGARAQPPRISYAPPGTPLPPDALCAVRFGAAAATDDPRCVHVGLEPIGGAGLTELWHVDGPVATGRDGAVHWARSADFSACRIELDEREFGGIQAAAQHAYEALCAFQDKSSHPHLLRMWNYFDAVNVGAGDTERYRLFCAGRVAGFTAYTGARWPAATAIGRRDGSPLLQVYWLAGRAPGLPLENPRQISPYLYPRQYGPAPPVFSRAMLVSGELLLVSGTASILGHATHHAGDLARQLEETLNNIDSLRPVTTSTGGSLLKVYLRDSAGIATVEDILRRRLALNAGWLLLHADVCRSELLVEIDCVQSFA